MAALGPGPENITENAEHQRRCGYRTALGPMAADAVALSVYFKRIEWF